DLIARPHAQGATVTVAPEDTLTTAYARLKLYDVSQLPVLEGDRVVGMLDESDLLLALSQRDVGFSDPVHQAMNRRLEILAPQAGLTELLWVFAKDYVAIIVDEGRFLGIITRIDLLNHLRRKVD
ncbi:MAG: CBS domain-containing protein, partial [Rhodospirillales bacterium]|nr:CBS domain-containing protein [Rhodospirillales bacterium]